MPEPAKTVETGTIGREFLVHYINATPKAATTNYVRIGNDLEEYKINLNAEVTKKRNILGENSIKISSYDPSSSVDTYYAEKGNALYTFLQDIVDNRKKLDEVKTTALEVHTWDGTAGAYVAYEEEVYLEVKDYGGKYDGYQIPFDVHYTGKRKKGKFNESTNKFTAD